MGQKNKQEQRCVPITKATVVLFALCLFSMCLIFRSFEIGSLFMLASTAVCFVFEKTNSSS